MINSKFVENIAQERRICLNKYGIQVAMVATGHSRISLVWYSSSYDKDVKCKHCYVNNNKCVG